MDRNTENVTKSYAVNVQCLTIEWAMNRFCEFNVRQSAQILLGALCIGPWLLLLIYDVFLYLLRVAMYDIPVIGGRARKRSRPRAPSLSERPSGRLREFSVSLLGLSSLPVTVEAADMVDGLKQRLNRPYHIRITNEMTVNE
jgi:hypothetical protein